MDIIWIFFSGLNIGWRIRTFDWLCVRIIRDATSLPASHFFTTKHFKCQQSIYDEFTKSSWYRRWLFSLKCEISSKSILTIFTKVRIRICISVLMSKPEERGCYVFNIYFLLRYFGLRHRYFEIILTQCVHLFTEIYINCLLSS